MKSLYGQKNKKESWNILQNTFMYVCVFHSKKESNAGLDQHEGVCTWWKNCNRCVNYPFNIWQDLSYFTVGGAESQGSKSKVISDLNWMHVQEREGIKQEKHKKQV